MLFRSDPEGTGYLPDGGVVTDGGKIVEVGATADLKAKYPQAEFVDARAFPFDNKSLETRRFFPLICFAGQ